MNTRRVILIGLVVLVALGLGNFVLNSVETRSQLAQVASKDTNAEDEGVRKLMARGVLFDALQGGAPPETRLNAIAALQRLAQGGKNPDAFHELLQMLKDPDTESADQKTHPVRDAAKDAVAAVGAQYPDALLAAAKDPDGSIKGQAQAALKKIGAPMEQQMAAKLGDKDLRAPLGDILSSIGPETIPLIAPYLQPPLLDTKAKPDDLEKAKIDLIETLGKFKVADAAKPILPFQNDPDPNVRRSVITSLANIGDPVGAPVLIAALNDPATDASARAAAAGALGTIATPEATQALQKALSDYDLSVANAAAAGLERAGDKASGAMAAALKDPDPSVRARAASATGGLSSSALASQALHDPVPRVRMAAVGALGDVLLRAATLHRDLDALASAADPKAQDKAYGALVKDGGADELKAPNAPAGAFAHAVAALQARADAEKKADKRKKITDQIAKLQAAPAAPPVANVDAAALAPLLSELSDADGDTAQTAVVMLGRLGDTAVPPLVALLGSAPSDTVAYNASQALAQIGAAGGAVDPLVAVAQPGKTGARWAAITLGLIGDPKAAPALESLSHSPDSDTAYAAATALARVRPS